MATERRLQTYSEPATLILLSLADGPKHGYAIMGDVRDSMGVRIGPGTLYTAVAKLLRLGFIKALPSDDRLRPYEITSDGMAELERFARTWTPIVMLAVSRLS